MEKDNVIDLKKPETFINDPITDVRPLHNPLF